MLDDEGFARAVMFSLAPLTTYFPMSEICLVVNNNIICSRIDFPAPLYRG